MLVQILQMVLDGLASGKPLTTSDARKSPQENMAYAQPQQEDNTMIYAVAGVGIILTAGTVYIVLTKK